MRRYHDRVVRFEDVRVQSGDLVVRQVEDSQPAHSREQLFDGGLTHWFDISESMSIFFIELWDRSKKVRFDRSAEEILGIFSSFLPLMFIQPGFSSSLWSFFACAPLSILASINYRPSPARYLNFEIASFTWHPISLFLFVFLN